MEFKKYNSVENTFDREFMDRLSMEDVSTGEFVVQEKVHGANVCFITDGKGIEFGKRTGLVETGEKFYGYEELVERYAGKIRAAFEAVREDFGKLRALTIFGEMFGGNYPHPEVKSNHRYMMIQKGVYYCPEHEFYAFDMYVDIGDDSRYLTVDEMNGYFERVGFLYAKTLMRGTLSECLKFPNDLPSAIPEWMGLPPIEGNICEGVVIRPVKPAFLRNGSRVLLKNKNARFAEKNAVKRLIPEGDADATYSEALKNLIEEVEQYVTENRLNNVVSKIGQVSLPRETGKLIGLFSKDILEDFMKEHAGEYNMLEKNEQKTLNKYINGAGVRVIKEVYFKME